MRLLADRLTRALAGTRVGLGALTADRKATAMTQAAVATQVHQTLDFHVDFAAQVTLGEDLGDFATQLLDLLVGEYLDLCRRIVTGSCADALRGGATNTVDVGQRDNSVLVIRNVDACNTGHSVKLQLTAIRAPEAKKRAQDVSAVTKNNQPGSTLAAGHITRDSHSALALLVTRLRAADHSHDAVATDDLAVAAQLLHRCTNFHHQLLEPYGYLAQHAAAIALQVGFLHQGFVLVRNEVRLYLRHEVHHNHDHDQQRGPAKVERYVCCDHQKLWKQAHGRHI